ncbi:MAG: M23 family metallopeptidase [Firmicutes bacterium]|nr:M23 family metallopeptidase [Bacillota bacterium]MCL2771377.1 M23 family metallopeptidase [Bacillota bacterium]
MAKRITAKRTIWQKTRFFLRKYFYYIIVAVLVVAVSLGIVITLTANNNRNNNNTGDVPVITPPITAILPMLNADVAKPFEMSTLLWNNTLRLYEVNDAIMFVSSTSQDVLAILPGVVSSITNDMMTGTVVTVMHDGGYQSIYRSLAPTVSVSEGQRLVQGALIGQASNSAGNASTYGDHLQFQMKKDNKIINPGEVIKIDNENK